MSVDAGNDCTVNVCDTRLDSRELASDSGGRNTMPGLIIQSKTCTITKFVVYLSGNKHVNTPNNNECSLKHTIRLLTNDVAINFL